MQLEFKVVGQELKRIDKNVLAANSRGYLKAHFDLPPDYTGLISAYFKIQENNAPSGESVLLDENFICAVPSGVIKTGIVYVSLSCTDALKHITTNECTMKVSNCGEPSSILPTPDGTINQYESFQEMYQEVKAEADKIDLTDTVTNVNYKIGISDGLIYLEEVI
jgi:hypothetical protein